MLLRSMDLQVKAALESSPAVFLGGARQTGKSTLVRSIVDQRGGKYVTFDDAAVRAAAAHDAEGFVAGLPRVVALDEIQRAPQIFLALKAAIDRDRSYGRFLLTGSAGVMVVPELADALVGRVRLLTLHSLSVGETLGYSESFIEWLFSGAPPKLSDQKVIVPSVRELALRGGFPEVVTQLSQSERPGWFSSYLETLVDREVRQLSAIDGLSTLPILLQLIAARSAKRVNQTELANVSGLPLTTLRRYLALLEGVYAIEHLPAWSRNSTKRVARSAKLLMGDTGLMANLLGLSWEWLDRDPERAGALVETFVGNELRKQIDSLPVRPRLMHFRTASGNAEVDFVIERADGSVAGVEVKAGRTLDPRSFRGMTSLRSAAGDAFSGGVLLYDGDEVVPFGDRLWALPISSLWRVEV